jgi:hypothetical protein
MAGHHIDKLDISDWIVFKVALGGFQDWFDLLWVDRAAQLDQRVGVMGGELFSLNLLPEKRKTRNKSGEKLVEKRKKTTYQNCMNRFKDKVASFVLQTASTFKRILGSVKETPETRASQSASMSGL